MDYQLNERLAARGFRNTSHREHVYNVILAERDHPTAEQIFLRAKKGMPDISMATVYNCLDALVKSGLVREVNVDRAATRYCPNMREHGHFYCDVCGGIYDVEFRAAGTEKLWELPQGFAPAGVEISIRGVCARCAARQLA